MDHIDWLKFMMWASQHRQEFGIAITKLGKECGFSLMPVPSNRNDQCWVNNWLNLIPHSVLTGQASGTAAALAVKHGVQPRDVNVRELQTYLKAEGIYLEQEADPNVKVELKEAVVVEDSAAADDFYDMVSGIVNK